MRYINPAIRYPSYEALEQNFPEAVPFLQMEGDYKGEWAVYYRWYFFEDGIIRGTMTIVKDYWIKDQTKTDVENAFKNKDDYKFVWLT